MNKQYTIITINEKDYLLNRDKFIRPTEKELANNTRTYYIAGEMITLDINNMRIVNPICNNITITNI